VAVRPLFNASWGEPVTFNSFENVMLDGINAPDPKCRSRWVEVMLVTVAAERVLVRLKPFEAAPAVTAMLYTPLEPRRFPGRPHRWWSCPPSFSRCRY
jgi:hypothetical protein